MSPAGVGMDAAGGPGGPAASTQGCPDARERSAAREAAIAASFAVQLVPGDQALDPALERAVRCGWPEVEVAVRYTRAVAALFGDDPSLPARETDGLQQAAARSGDPTGVSCALVLRSLVSGAGRRPETADADLARAVALLDEPRAADSGIPIGLAWMNAAIVHGEQEFYEIEAELYEIAEERARAAGDARSLGVIAYNRLFTQARIACVELLLGRRGEAAAAVDGVDGLAGVVESDGRWVEFRPGVAAIRQLAATLTGRPVHARTAARLAGLASSGAPHLVEAGGTAHLALALTATATGRWRAAVRHATRARAAFDGASGRPMGELAEHLAAGAAAAQLTGPAADLAEAALADARASALRRRAERLRLVAAARARLAAERLRRERDGHAADAVTDELTGLANRRGWAAAVAGADGSGRRAAVLMVDVDRFKAVNDTFGHPVGDRVLRRVAAELRSRTRVGDTCARLGGDEFAALLPGAGPAVAAERAAAVAAAVASVSWHELAPGLSVTVSVGAAPVDAAGPGDAGGGRFAAAQLAADAALYRSKAAGGACSRLAVPGERAGTGAPLACPA